MLSIIYGGVAKGNKKPTTVASRGFLVKFQCSTSASGIAGYDEYQNDSLLYVFQH